MAFFDRLQGEAPRYGWARDAHKARWNPAEVARRTSRQRDERRVCIIGGGASGIHMAWLLRRRGFRNVTVFERNDYVGGKVLTLEAGGVKHEMGACYTTPAYRQVRALLSEFGLYDRAPVAGRTIIRADGTEQTFGDWASEEFASQLQGIAGRLPSLGVGLFVLRDIWRYNRLHRSIFGRYDGTFPPRPSQRGLEQMQGTFLEYLERNKLQTLIPVMRLFQSAQGYGYIEQVPAYYGLLWNDPGTMKIVIEQLTGRGRQGGADLTKAGMQTLFTEMVARSSIDVRLYHEVVRIERDDPIQVRTRDRRSGAELVHDCDLLVVATNARQALDWLDSPTDDERALFGTQTTHQMTTSLQKGRQRNRHGIDSWLHHAVPGKDHHVTTQRLSRFYLDPEGYEAQPVEEPDYRVVFQYGAMPASREQISDRYARHYRGEDSGIAVDGEEVIDRRFWTYFPHWDDVGIQAGNPWKVLDLQGQNRTFWVGASACFESLRDIVNYNLLLMSEHFDE
ncbi:MAG: FAD-dependent oxidoreductase [Myxococcota bacterium]